MYQTIIATILVATDGSEHAIKAVDLAADLATKYDARSVLCHVLRRDAALATVATVNRAPSR